MTLHPGAKAALLLAFAATATLAPLPVVAAVLVGALAVLARPRAIARVLLMGAVLVAMDALVLRLALGDAMLGVRAGVRGTVLLALGFAFAARTTSWEVLAALGRWPRAAVALAAVMRMAPDVGASARRLDEAARLRGASRLARARLVVPLVVASARRGERFGDALRLAGFPSATPRYRRPPWRAPDVVVVGAAVAVVAALAFALSRGAAAWT